MLIRFSCVRPSLTLGRLTGHGGFGVMVVLTSTQGHPPGVSPGCPPGFPPGSPRGIPWGSPRTPPRGRPRGHPGVHSGDTPGDILGGGLGGCLGVCFRFFSGMCFWVGLGVRWKGVAYVVFLCSTFLDIRASPSLGGILGPCLLVSTGF